MQAFGRLACQQGLEHVPRQDVSLDQELTESP
jgi:hypothetical protein